MAKKHSSTKIIEKIHPPIEQSRLALLSVIEDQRKAQQELKASESRYKNLLETARDIIFTISVEGTITSLNNEFETVTGWSKSDWLEKNIREGIVHPDDWQLAEKTVRRTALGTIPPLTEVRVKTKSGNFIIGEFIMTPQIHDGKVTEILGIGRDITRRRQAEEQLQMSNTTYEGILNSITETIYIQDEQGVFLKVSLAAEKMYGYPPDYFIGRTPEFISAPGKNNLAEIADYVRQAFNGQQKKFEFWGIRKDGTIFPKDVILTPGKYFGQNVVIAVARDITERKRAEEKIQSMEKHFRALIEKTADGIVLVGKDGKLKYASPSAKRITGYNSDEEFNLDPAATTHPDDVPIVLSTLTEITQDPLLAPTIQYRYKHQKNGSWRWVESTFSNLIADPNVEALVINFRDITDRKNAEESLQNREAYLTAIIENQPGLIWLKDKKNRFLAVNKKLVQVVGMQSSEEIIGKTDFDINPKHLAEKYTADDLRVMETGESIIVEEIIVDKGKEKWFATYKSQVKDNNGEIIGTTGLALDITERKRMEDELRRSEEQFSQLFNLSPDAMNLCSLPDGKYLAVNQRFVELSGYSLEEVLDKTSSELNFWVDIEHRNKFGNMLKTGNATIETQLQMHNGRIIEALMSGKLIEINGMPHLLVITRDITKRKQEEKQILMLAETIKGITECVSITDVNDHILFVNKAFEETYGYSAGEMIGKSITIVRSPKTSAAVGSEILPSTLTGGWKGELWNKKKDGTEFPILLSTSAVKDLQGNITALVGITEDITKKKRTEQQLNLMSLSMQSAANAIVITDREGIIISVNPAFSNVTGYAAEEVVGKKPSILKSGKQSAEFYKNLWETIIAGEVWKGEITNKRKDGKEYTEEMTITPVRQTSGEITHFIAIKQDVTEQRSLQNQLFQSQKIQSIGTLAGGIAHDFNNILGIIYGYLYFLEQENIDKQMLKKSVSVIQDALNRAKNLVKQILTFARQTDTLFAELNVPNLVREIVSMLNETFSKIITIRTTIDLNIPDISADHTQIHQAILNLCVNARDAMPGGGEISIGIKTVVREELKKYFNNVDSPAYVCITVADTGTGMDEQTQARIFDPFFTTKEKGKGTGLGLSVVFGVMQSHNGFVRVESTVNVGTTFYLYLPVKTRTENIAPANSVKQTKTIGGTETILLVEDEELLRNVVKGLLETFGYTVLTASDGEEAVETYKQHQNNIAIVLTDVGLPKLTGFNEFKQLKAINKNVRVVFASGFFEPDSKSEMFKAGAKGFIQKPYNMDEILHKVREVLDIKQL